MQPNVYVYIAVMALVTYLIRVLPLTLIRRQIQNRTIRSFLFYMPYATLAVMTFPAILSATGTPWSALVGLIVAAAMAWRRCSLFTVASVACVAVFAAECVLL